MWCITVQCVMLQCGVVHYLENVVWFPGRYVTVWSGLLPGECGLVP